MINCRRYLRSCVALLFLIPSGTALAAGRIAATGTTNYTAAVPVQNYAVIDMSGNSTTAPVTAVALDNSNNAAFGFGTGTTVDAGPAQYHTYTWQNGNPSQGNVTTCSNYLVPSDPTPPHWNIIVQGITPAGSIFGDTEYPLYYSSATPIPYQANIPLAVGGSNYNSGAAICSESNSGNLAGNWYGIDYDGISFGVIYNNTTGGWTVFDGQAEFSDSTGPTETDYGTLPAGSTLLFDDFSPMQINNNCRTLGVFGIQSIFELGPTGNGLWNGAGYADFGADQPSEINNQNQVMVNSSFGESYLWESGTTTYLDLDALPLALYCQIYNATSEDFTKWLSDQATDGTIQILATAQNSGDSTDPTGPDPTENFVWTRDSSANWSFAEMQLPTGVSIDRFDTINPNGIIAALGKPSLTATCDHALLLLPVQLDFMTPSTATWTDTDVLQEKQVILFTDQTRIRVKWSHLFSSLSQVTANAGWDRINLKTASTNPGGTDYLFSDYQAETNFETVTGTDGRQYDQIEMQLSRFELQNNGSLPQNENDGQNEKAWYDTGANSPSAPSNLTDSEAFEAANTTGTMMGQASFYGHLYTLPTDPPPGGPNLPIDLNNPSKSFLTAGGGEVITANFAGASSSARMIAHQASTLYFSGHGDYTTATLALTGEGSTYRFGTADTQWDKHLNTVIVAGCSIFGIRDDKYRAVNFGLRDLAKYTWHVIHDFSNHTDPSPGEQWEPLAPTTKLGYCFTAPLDTQGSAAIIRDFYESVNAGTGPITAWGAANKLYGGVNACAIDTSTTPHRYYYFAEDQNGILTWTQVNKSFGGW